MLARFLLAIVLGLIFTAVTHAEIGRKPTTGEAAAIRDCAAKYKEDLDEGERKCLFGLVATPCTETPEGSSNLGTADCYRIEQAIWDELLNANFKALLETLDADQTSKLRAMQRAWIVYRDTTCKFYMDKIHGTMAIPMGEACVARETARRAMLLAFFSTL